MLVFHKKHLILFILSTVILLAGAGVWGCLYFTDILITMNYDRVTKYMSEKTSARVSFSAITGNLVHGLKILELKGESPSEEILDVDSLTIRFNLLKLWVGDIELITVRLDGGNISLDAFNEIQKPDDRHSQSRNTRKFSIRQCSIHNLKIHRKSVEIRIDADLQITADNHQSKLFLKRLSIQQGEWSGTLDSTLVTFTDQRIIAEPFSYTIVNGDTIKGTLSVSLETNQWGFPVDFNLKGKEKSNKLTIDDLDLRGVVFADKFKLQRGSVRIDTSLVEISGQYSFTSGQWDAQGIFNEFTAQIDSVPISLTGSIRSMGRSIADTIFFDTDISDLQYNMFEINHVKGEVSYIDSVLINTRPIEFSLVGVTGLIDSLFIKKDRYKISGQAVLKNFSPGSYIAGLPTIKVTGVGSINIVGLPEKTGINSKLFLKPVTYQKLNLGDSYWEASTRTENGKMTELELIGNTKSLKFPLVTLDRSVIKAHYRKGKIDLDHLYGYNEKGDFIFISGYTDSLMTQIVLDSIFLNLNGVRSYSGKLDITSENEEYNIICDNLALNSGNISLSGKYADPEKFEFDMKLTDINIEDVVKMLRLEHPVSGIINGNSQFSKWNTKPVLFSDIHITNGTLGEIKLKKLDGKFSFFDHRLLIDKVTAGLEQGSVDFSGWVESSLDTGRTVTFLPEDSLSILAKFDGFQIESIKPYFPWEFRTAGKVSGNMDITGQLSHMYMASDIRIDSPAFDQILGKVASGKLIYSNKKLFLRETRIQLDDGDYAISGFIPLDLDYFSEDRAFSMRNPIDLLISGKTRELDFIYPYFDIIDSLFCDCSIQLSIDGTFESPIRNGQVILNHGIANVSPLKNTFTDIEGIVTIDDNILKISSLSGKSRKIPKDDILNTPLYYLMKVLHLSRNPKTPTQNIKVEGSMDLTEFFNPGFNLVATGKNIYLEDVYDTFAGMGKANFRITGRDTIFISGTFEPDPYEFTISPVMSTASDITGTDISEGKMMIYDIHIPMDTGVIIKNEYMDIEIEGEISLTAVGTNDFVISGNINIVGGSFFLNGNEFTDTEGRITFDPASDYPEMDIIAYTYLNGLSYKVLFSGQINNPILGFESEDPTDAYSQDEILRILLAGDESLIAGKDFKIQDAGTNIISNYLETELERLITLKSPVDRFQLESQGALLKDMNNIDVNLYMGKRLSRKMYMNIKSDIFSTQIKSEYEIVYRMDKNQSVVVRLDDQGFPHLNYRIKFKY